jgi:hypothetical protein
MRSAGCLQSKTSGALCGYPVALMGQVDRCAVLVVPASATVL